MSKYFFEGRSEAAAADRDWLLVKQSHFFIDRFRMDVHENHLITAGVGSHPLHFSWEQSDIPE